MNEEPKIPEIKQPVVPIKPAAKTLPKQPELKASEVTEIPKPSFKHGDPGVSTRSGFRPVSPGEITGIIDIVPKECLPTLLVKLANRCLSEKVFATGREMADAIAGAIKK